MVIFMYALHGNQTNAGASFKTPSLGEAKKTVKTWLVDDIGFKQLHRVLCEQRPTGSQENRVEKLVGLR